MNVLVLTPDAVGSTLLQRLLTIYMNFHEFDKPVINLHELTNGLVKYHSDQFNREILSKPEKNWGYYQSLSEVVELLDSVDHYKTSRLAHYHLINRADTIKDQVPFYQYLNDNFFIIACRRNNLFEHALSWCISKVTKKINVYESEEKIRSFFHVYKNGIELDTGSLIQTLENYKRYIKWCENHFNVASYFYYEDDLPRIEDYILNLPVFAEQTTLRTWQDQFGIDFDTWNKCHYYQSDLGTLALTNPTKFAELGTTLSLPSTNEVQQASLPALLQTLPEAHRNFLTAYQQGYDQAAGQIAALKQARVMVSGPPIKKQTLAEKKYIVKNFDRCLEVFNYWLDMNPQFGAHVYHDELKTLAQREHESWFNYNNDATSSANLLAVDSP